ncbi:LOW QUALITY PROTEIN: hypothetical protein V1477_002409 [Vespula maculifrons]|uniref:Uncharacterized protein n=1 Tax=Vespula maculifrons TaxID=7453 RepID=A0ABD2CWE8_VESMC
MAAYYNVVSNVSSGTLRRGTRVWAVGRVTVSTNFYFSFQLLYHFCFRIHHRGIFAARKHNNIGPVTVFDYFNEHRSALSEDAGNISPPEDIDTSTECHNSKSEYSWTVNTKIRRLLIADLNGKWGYSLLRDDNKVGSLTDHYNAIEASINEGLTQVQCGIIDIFHILCFLFCFRFPLHFRRTLTLLSMGGHRKFHRMP